jgi:hypothetical protein
LIRWPGILLVLCLVAGCGDRAAREPEAVESWMRLYEVRDFFRLRDAMGPVDAAADASPRVLFLRAAVQHSFNRPEDSTATVEALLERDDVPGELRKDALLLRLSNFVRLYRYADAARVAEEILSLDEPSLGEEERGDVENTRKLMQALADVPPQEIVARETTLLDYGTDGRIAVRIQDVDYRIPFDTGANLSLLMRSEVDRLGLEVRPAAIEVGTFTDMKVYADLAVADRVEIGGLEYRNVVLLVVPDELLTFPGGHVIEGFVGFPLIEAMGEIHFRRDGTLEIPGRVPDRAVKNLALDQFESLVRVGFEGKELVCRLDTGADDTAFYEPFYRRYPELFEALGEPSAVESGGVGGVRTLAAYTLPSIELELGGIRVSTRDVDVYTNPITDEASNYLYCNIGRNTLAGFDEYAINFRSMSLITGTSDR